MTDLTMSQFATTDDLIAALQARVAACNSALDFAAGAIEDAIYSEDGLDGVDGEHILHIITEARERGEFDKAKYGQLEHLCPFNRAEKAEAERDAALARAAGFDSLASDRWTNLLSLKRELDAALAEVAKLRAAGIALQDDLLARAETVDGERVVAAGATAWANFCDVMGDARSGSTT